MTFVRRIRFSGCMLGLLAATVGACSSAPESGPAAVESAQPPSADSSLTALRAAWIRSMQEGASASYGWLRGNDGELHARSGSLRFSLGARGLGLALGEDVAVRLRTRTVGRAGNPQPVPTTSVELGARTNQAWASHGGVREKWVHGPLGIEHLYELPERPRGVGELIVQIEIEGLRAALHEARSVDLVGPGGLVRARYAELYVEDAAGRRLPARFEVDHDGASVSLRIDDEGAVYPLLVDPLLSVEEAALGASGPAAGDELGIAVSISNDGTRALVGAHLDDTPAGTDAGSARVFVRSGATWSEEAILMQPSGSAGDHFGRSVALSADGSVALVGAPDDDTSDGADAGSASVFIRSGSTWTHDATLIARYADAGDAYGSSVAISGDGATAVVGAPNNYSNGVVWVYSRGSAGWSSGTLLQPYTNAGRLGTSVAISADGTTIAAGAPMASTGSTFGTGNARIYTPGATADSWVERAVVTSIVPTNGDAFGTSVAISGTGTVVLVGVPNATGARGRAEIFELGTSGWAYREIVGSTDLAIGDRFGSAVALSTDGRRALVGIHGADAPSGSDAGAAMLVDLTASGTSGYSKLLAADGAAGDAFGRSVAISGDGTRALIGVPTDDTTGGADAGSARVFTVKLGAAAGTPCTSTTECSGFCVDGVCCATACGGGASDCQACSVAAGGTVDGTCTPLSATAAATVTCRASAGPCDAAETCSPTSTTCPSDAFAGGGTLCRAAAGPCDVAETCSGTSVDCPTDTFASYATTCRPSAGPCDVVELCTGTSASCPPDGFVSAGTICRASAGACDVAETCTGSSPTCPTDGFASSATICRPSAGVCDIAESCTGASASCPSDGARPEGSACGGPPSGACDAQDVCVGTSGASAFCKPRVAPAGTTCRSASCVGGVEIASGTCNGSSTTCSEATSRTCGAYACGPTACLTSCASTADCAAGHVCVGSACVAPATDGGVGDADADSFDAAATDTGVTDTSAAADTSVTDTSAADTGATDTGAIDSSATDADTATTDTATADTAVPNSDAALGDDGGSAGPDAVPAAGGCACDVSGVRRDASYGAPLLAALLALSWRRRAAGPRERE